MISHFRRNCMTIRSHRFRISEVLMTNNPGSSCRRYWFMQPLFNQPCHKIESDYRRIVGALARSPWTMNANGVTFRTGSNWGAILFTVNRLSPGWDLTIFLFRTSEDFQAIIRLMFPSFHGNPYKCQSSKWTKPIFEPYVHCFRHFLKPRFLSYSSDRGFWAQD